MSLWSDVFTRSRSPRSVTPEEFTRLEALKSEFGSQPPQTDTPGGRINYHSRAYRYWSAYQSLEKDFADLAKSFLNDEQLDRVVTSTGGRPVFWKSRSGAVYMALLDVAFIATPIYRFPDVFNDPNRGDPVNDVWMSILRKGGVIAFPPDGPDASSGWDRVGPGVRALNERNIKALQDAGLLSVDAP